MRNTDLGQQNPWSVRAGQFDRENRDSRDFFSIHAGELEQCEDQLRPFSAESAVKAWPLFMSGRTTRFPTHRKLFRDEIETQFMLPAHTDPIHSPVDPGSDTIARG
jgi:hypothetical protein